MTKAEYIQSCGVNYLEDLTDDQIVYYYAAGHGDMINWHSALIIKNGGAFSLKIDRAKAVAMLRQAFEQDKFLRIIFIEGEGVVGDGYYPPAPHFEISLDES